jgi:hypothetical protein
VGKTRLVAGRGRVQPGLNACAPYTTAPWPRSRFLKVCMPTCAHNTHTHTHTHTTAETTRVHTRVKTYA